MVSEPNILKFFKQVRITHFWFVQGQGSAFMKSRYGLDENNGLCPMSIRPCYVRDVELDERMRVCVYIRSIIEQIYTVFFF